MADTAEIANLLVRLTGDAAGFQRMLTDAIAQTKSFGATVTQTLASIAEFAGFRGSLNAFTEFQDDLVRIETTVKANGLAVQETMKDYKEFAQQIEDTTRVSAISATNLLAMAHSFDLVGEKAQKAVRLAVGISQGRPGVSPMEVIRALSMFWRTSEITAGHGSSGGGGASNMGIFYLARILGLYGRGMGGRGQGEGGAETSKKMIEEINKQLKIAEDISGKLGQNFGGQLARIKSYLQDVGVELGGIVAKWLQPFVDQLQKAVKWFKELDPAVKQIVTLLFSLATLLTVGGPIMRFFLLLAHMSASISPLTLALTAAVVATGVWIKAVGGLEEAYRRVYERVVQLVQDGLRWLDQFIATHRRLVLALGLIAAAVGTVLVAWRLLRTAIVLIDTILTALYLKQLAQQALLLSWAAAAFTLHTALTALRLLFTSAAWVVGLTLTLTRLVALTAAYYVHGAAVLAVKAALLAFTLVSAVAGTIVGGLAALVSGAAILWASWSMTVWAVNTAVAVGVGLLAAYNTGLALTVAWIGTVTTLFATAFVTAWVAGKTAVAGFLDTLLSIPGRSGPLAAVSSIFQEWFGILRSVYQAITLLPGSINRAGAAALGLKKDMSGMDLAWELLVAGFHLAVAQIKAVWPPLWTFIQTVALAAWKVIQAGWNAFVDAITPPFKLAFSKLVNYLQMTLGKSLAQFFASLVQVPEGLMAPAQRALNKWASGLYTQFVNMGERAENVLKKNGYEGMAEDQKRAAESINKLNEELKKQQQIIADAAKKFNGKDTPEVKAARDRVEELRKLIQQATAEQKKDQKGLDLGAPYRAAQKDIQKWEATLVGSAEAYSRIQEYFDKLNESGEKAGIGEAGEGGGGPRPEPGPGVPPPGRNGEGGGGKGGETGIQNLHKLIKGYMDKGWPVLVTGIKNGGKIGNG